MYRKYINNMLPKIRFFFFVSVISLLPFCAQGQVVVKDSVLSFMPNERLMKTFPVGNVSQQEALKVRVQVLKLVQTKPEEKYIKTQDVLVVPQQLKLAPRRSQLVRVLVKEKERAKDAVYRLQFVPEKLKKHALKKENVQQGLQDKSQVSVLSGASVLMWVAPEKPEVSYETEWNDAGVRITNTGNTNFILRQEKNCVKGFACTIDGVRLWAGESWQLNIPESFKGEKFLLELRALDKISTIELSEE